MIVMIMIELNLNKYICFIKSKASEKSYQGGKVYHVGNFYYLIYMINVSVRFISILNLSLHSICKLNINGTSDVHAQFKFAVYLHDKSKFANCTNLSCI